jgi:hypothetical protein
MERSEGQVARAKEEKFINFLTVKKTRWEVPLENLETDDKTSRQHSTNKTHNDFPLVFIE